MRMVREPAELNGFSFPDSDSRDKFTNPCSIVTRICEEAGGHPYYVKRICFHLVDWLRRQRKNNISEADVDHALRDVLLYGSVYFDHFIRALSPVGTRVLVAVANHIVTDGHVSQEEIIKECERFKPHLSKDESELALTELEKTGCIQILNKHYIYIPVKIFARYANEILIKKEKRLN